MSHRLANATGNFNTAATWLQGANTPTLHASTDVSLSTSASYSATFTAPNTTNAVTGCLVYLTGKGTATTITATLQDNSVDTAHTATITLASVNTGWIFFKPAATYTYVSTSAGRYRWKLVVNSGTTTTVAQATSADFAYISFDNRQVVPVSNDNVYIIGSQNQTAITVTLNGTQTIGTGGVPTNGRSITGAMMLGNGGMLSGITSATHSLTHAGSIVVQAGGELRVGTTGSPLSSSYTSTFEATTNNGGIYILTDGKATLQGTPKSSTSLWKTTKTSGVGTAASPLVTSSAVDWSVNDQILIAAATDSATNYNETESRYIITKNSSTSYVLSTTLGGAEAAFTYTHAAGTDIVNVTRNIIIKGSSSLLRTAFMCNAQTVAGNVDVDWVRFSDISVTNFLGVPTQYISLGSNCNMDYSVAYDGGSCLFAFGGSTAMTYTGLIGYSTITSNGTGVLFGSFNFSNALNKTLVDCFSMANGGHGFAMSGSYTNTLTRCKAYASGFSGLSVLGGLYITGSGQNTFTDCEFHANNTNGFYYNNGAGNTFTSCDFGTKGFNTTNDIDLQAGFIDALFDTCNFESPTMVDGYLGMTNGSEVRFNTLNGTTNNHRWYTIYGMASSAGSGLSDTTVRTPGSLAVRIAPEEATTGFTWDFLLPVKANSLSAFFGYFRKNTAFGTSVARVELWLPGSLSADDSVTLTNSTEVWQTAVLSAPYTGSTDGLAQIRIVGVTTTASAYLYCDDFFNAGDTVTNYDKMTGLDTWYKGKPSPVISPSSVSAADIWTYDTTNLTTANTTGNQVKKLLTVGKFLGLK